MKFHYIASDTKRQYDLEWDNAFVLPFGGMDWRAIMHADYIPGCKCRWCAVGQEKYENGEMTISCYDENTILNTITQIFEEHNSGKDLLNERE